MDLKQLHAFITVADEGSISAGAKKLYMTQPPLSSLLKGLEEELNCTLFERGARRITLTEPGKTLYAHAKTLLDLRRVAEEEVRAVAAPDRGTVRVGIVSSLAGTTALEWIREFSETYPEIDFAITEGNTFQMLDLLSAGTIHTALVRTPYQKGSFRAVRMTQEPLVAVGSAAYFAPRRKTADLPLLAKAPLIVYRRWSEPLREIFRQNGIAPRIRVLADDARTVIAAAETGLGIGIIPASAAPCVDPARAAVRSVRGLNLSSAVELISDPSRHIPDCARRFIAHLTEKAGIAT